MDNEQWVVEPTALAKDMDKPPIILEGDDAERFLKRMREVEKNVKRVHDKALSVSELESQNSFNRMMLKMTEAKLKELKERIRTTEEKIQELKSGQKTEEQEHSRVQD